jgi:toxin-antitoxin system PIN domain toxin
VSYAIDSNILLYASDEASDLCERAKTFLRECSARSEPFCLCWPVAMAYLRIATHPRIFTSPLTPSTAMGNIEALISLPHCRLISEGSRFWSCYQSIASKIVVRANLVPDAHVAALLIEHDIPTIYTRDKDFAKFDGITPLDPLRDPQP